MEFFPIFGEDDTLLSAHFANEELDEFTRIFREWADIEFLTQFFIDNLPDLNKVFWNGIDPDQAASDTLIEAQKLRDSFFELSKVTIGNRIQFLKKFFRPLGGFDSNEQHLVKKKAYGLKPKTWLRIYAIKVGDDSYIITGGTIKLMDTMGERSHTNRELEKLQKCKDFLLQKGIIDKEGLTDLLECGDYEE